jgi:hydroxyacylglutathione hydrolase
VKIEKFVNTIFKSNSYLLDFEGDKGIWLIDPGDSKPLIQWMIKNNKYLKGIIITHSHFDHIYGINDLYELFPDVKIFSSKEAKEGMLSAKLNSSYYTDYPFVVECPNICIVEENNNIQLSEKIHARVIYTPGHNNDCISFEIKHYGY